VHVPVDSNYGENARKDRALITIWSDLPVPSIKEDAELRKESERRDSRLDDAANRRDRLVVCVKLAVKDEGAQRASDRER